MAETQGATILRQVRKLVAAHENGRLADQQLLEQFLTRRDEAAFAALVQRHGPGVLSLCRSLLSHLQDAEDVLQATFLVLARKADSIRRRASLGSWLYGVAHRLACKARARAARRAGQELTAAESAEARPGEDITWRDLRRVLHEELTRLPEKYRAPLLLCYWEGKTQEEAAAQLGWTKGTLKERVHRARELLRGRLTRRGVTLSAGLATALLADRAGTAAEVLTLVQPTTRAALAFAAGKPAAAGGFPAAAAALAEGVVRAMFVTKLKIAAAVLLTLGLLGAGAGLAYQDAAPAASGAPKPGKAKSDQERIQGTWILQSGEKGGKPAPEAFINSVKAVFAGNKLTIHVEGEMKEGTFTLKPGSKPKEIDLVRDDKAAPGIYRLEGNRLTLCVDDLGQTRPTEFKSAPGTGQLLLVFRREKAGKGEAPKGSAELPEDPAKLKLIIEKLRDELAQTRAELAVAQAQLKAVQALAERSQVEAQRQRAQAEQARQEALRELERARAAEDAARLNVERIKVGGAANQLVMNKLKQMALAMHNYNDAYGHFPPAAIYGKDGKPLLSWRVAILPFIEQDALYRQFKLDEPWDSPHNKKLLAQMPDLYASVHAKAGRRPTQTPYRVFTGPKTVFPGKEGSRIQDITDGTSNTILIVEAAEVVPWTKPDELPYAPGKPLPQLGGQARDGFFFAMCDGSVRLVRTPVNEQVLRALITRNGGEVVDPARLSKQ